MLRSEYGQLKDKFVFKNQILRQFFSLILKLKRKCWLPEKTKATCVFFCNIFMVNDVSVTLLEKSN